MNQYISDAQFGDVQNLLGTELYNDLIRNSTSTAYKSLLNGGNYTYNNKTYTNVGLKAVIVFYAYSRYVLFGSNVDTPFGHVVKTNPNSQPSDYMQKKAIAKSNEQMAFKYWESVRDFIERNKTDYPLWESDCLENRVTSVRISKIE